MSTARQRASFRRFATAVYIGEQATVDADDLDAIGQLVDDRLPAAETVETLRARRSPLVRPRP